MKRTLTKFCALCQENFRESKNYERRRTGQDCGDGPASADWLVRSHQSAPDACITPPVETRPISEPSSGEKERAALYVFLQADHELIFVQDACHLAKVPSSQSSLQTLFGSLHSRGPVGGRAAAIRNKLITGQSSYGNLIGLAQ